MTTTNYDFDRILSNEHAVLSDADLDDADTCLQADLIVSDEEGNTELWIETVESLLLVNDSNRSDGGV